MVHFLDARASYIRRSDGGVNGLFQRSGKSQTFSFLKCNKIYSVCLESTNDILKQC